MLLPVSDRRSHLVPRFQGRLAPGWLRSRYGRATGAWPVCVAAERRPREAVVTSTLSLVAWQQSFATTAAIMTAGRPQDGDTSNMTLKNFFSNTSDKRKRLMKKGVVRVGQR